DDQALQSSAPRRSSDLISVVSKQAGPAGGHVSGAPAPAGQSLEDMHPLFAGNHHDPISAGGLESCQSHYPSTVDEATNWRRSSSSRAGCSSAIGRPWL